MSSAVSSVYYWRRKLFSQAAAEEKICGRLASIIYWQTHPKTPGFNFTFDKGSALYQRSHLEFDKTELWPPSA
ncbi:hypothetical protein ACPOL_0218 [Acidisarcina polymorpha]|uniref:Uncharacterized protein n=1 Tax=Acidisarcina polymorpha TaxID=2211140 RepID=A0A2Z5FS72_9BACT|nr:hypothetical protein ACPOL_0218 [Acidisarcina polymorpha]